ncbi:hypothetical protein NPIL_124961, partial [Nephila pilipes]
MFGNSSHENETIVCKSYSEASRIPVPEV